MNRIWKPRKPKTQKQKIQKRNNYQVHCDSYWKCRYLLIIISKTSKSAIMQRKIVSLGQNTRHNLRIKVRDTSNLMMLMAISHWDQWKSAGQTITYQPMLNAAFWIMSPLGNWLSGFTVSVLCRPPFYGTAKIKIPQIIFTNWLHKGRDGAIFYLK